MNLLLVHVLLEAGVEVSPPLEEERVADELEPGSELEAGVLKQLLQTIGADILGRLDLVGAGVQVDVGLDEQDVVDWGDGLAEMRNRTIADIHTLVLAPFAVAGSLVVDAGQEAKVLNGDLFLLDAQLVVELALGGALDAHDGVGEVGARLAGDAQRVGAAGVCPHVGEGDLLGGALLEQQLVLIVEQEDGKGAVQETLVDVGHEMT